MGQLIDGLLALSRLGREKVIFSEIDMNDLARTVFEEQKAAGAKNRQISFKLDGLPPAYGDKRLLAQVFHNLLSNAIKFTRNEKHAEIEIGSMLGALEAIYFVRANGVGFDMDHARKLFGTVQRLTRAGKLEGTAST